MLGSEDRHDEQCRNYDNTINVLTAERDAFHSQLARECLLRHQIEDKLANAERHFKCMTDVYEKNIIEARSRIGVLEAEGGRE